MIRAVTAANMIAASECVFLNAAVKPLLCIGSMTMIEFSVDNMLEGVVGSAPAVLGYRSDEMQSFFE